MITRSIGQSMSRRMRRGVGMVELLVSLAIAASLLTATAVAVDASFKAYAINQEQAALMQQARVAMNRVLSLVRTSDAHAPEGSTLLSSFAQGNTVTGTAVAMFDPHGAQVIFRHNITNETLDAEVNGAVHVLARGVTAFTVKLEPMRSAESIKTGGGWDLLKRATILMSIRTTAVTSQVGESTGNQLVTLSGSAVPRKNAW